MFYNASQKIFSDPNTYLEETVPKSPTTEGPNLQFDNLLHKPPYHGDLSH